MKANYKWLVLAVYSGVAGLSQLLWLNFAPILTNVENKYLVSESQASLLILVFPLVYVLLSVPAGAFIDRFGYKRGIGLGVFIMALFTALRIFDDMFIVLLIAQTGIAIAQPFIINGISKLVLDWFERSQTAMATGIGTMGMFIGMAVGLAATPLTLTSYGFRGSMILFTVLTLFLSALYFIFVRENPNGRYKKGSETLVTESTAKTFKFLMQDKSLLLLFSLSFLGLGFFNGLTTWLELILAPQGINSEQAGIAGGVLILGGIVGAGVIPAISDFVRRRKPFLILSLAIATFTLYPLCFGKSYHSVLVYSALQGFFFLPAYAILLEMCADLVGVARAASATSLLMLAGNAGGVVVVVAMEAVKRGDSDFTPAVTLMLGILGFSLLLSFFLPETRERLSRDSSAEALLRSVSLDSE